MSHRAFLERWFAELWGQRNEAIIDECRAPDCVAVGLPGVDRGNDGFRAFFRAFGAAFPRFDVTVEDCLEDGERFAFRAVARLTARAGREHRINGGGMGAIRDGKFVEVWNHWDFLTLAESMDAVARGTMERLLAA